MFAEGLLSGEGVAQPKSKPAFVQFIVYPCRYVPASKLRP